MRSLLALVLLGVARAFHDVMVDNVTCMVCNSSQFCANGSAFQCPASSDSQEPRTLVEHCVCWGWFMRRNDTCELGLHVFFTTASVIPDSDRRQVMSASSASPAP